jgi:hypothetical protein
MAALQESHRLAVKILEPNSDRTVWALTSAVILAAATAFMTAAGAPNVPASPQRLAQSGLCAHSVAWVERLNAERLSARGRQ